MLLARPPSNRGTDLSRRLQTGKSAAFVDKQQLNLPRPLISQGHERNIHLTSRAQLKNEPDAAIYRSKAQPLTLSFITQLLVAKQPSVILTALIVRHTTAPKEHTLLMKGCPGYFSCKTAHNRLQTWVDRTPVTRSLLRMESSGMLRRVTLVTTDVSEELSASFIRVTKIGELGTTLAVTSNGRTPRTNTQRASVASYGKRCS
jgi:hypothetical protein